ncbi:MAG: HEAT repeat domain-containing protein [Methanophagales archaeon]|nr:HEAT repeat domain-containing protein [Methanophagales archaeon]
MGIFDLFKPDVEKLEKKKDVQGLIKALQYKKDRDVRGAAAKALGNIRDKRAVEPLVQALKDEYLRVRRGVAETLGKIGDKRAVEPLIHAFGDETHYVSHLVKDTAHMALEQIKRSK